MRYFKIHNRKDRGYILPAALALSFAIAIVSVGLLRATATSSETLNNLSYVALAEDAAQSGIAYADSCLLQGLNWHPSNPLRPNTGCSGTGNTGSAYVAQHGTEWRSTFSVSAPDGQDNILSTGTVEILKNGSRVKAYTASAKMPVGSGFRTYPVAKGESITAIKAQSTDCAIANGKLYCWGQGGYGQIGDNGSSDRSNPTLVGGAATGKTITHVDVSDSSVCAIADGTPYCWGGNGNGQLGSGNYTTYRQPTANVPRYASGVLSGQFATDISTAPSRLPASIPPWPVALAFQHSCSLRADGATACWGSNGFRQLSTKARFCIGVPISWGDICVGLEIFAYPDTNTPILINGYGNTDENSSSPWTGKKTERVGASSHDSCLIAEGRMYCMGVEVPLNPLCSTPSPLFLPANIISVNLNVCNASFSGGYDMSSKAGLFSSYNINSRPIDPKSWQLNTNMACGMASASFFCVGEGPTAGFQWGGSFKPPWEEIANADITSHDNGDNESLISLGLDGMYCVIDKGVAKCKPSLVAGLLYSGGAPIMGWGPINTTHNATTGINDNIPIKIATGTMHGCVAANGRLYCWGNASNGRLANGSTNGLTALTYATHTGTGGTTPIGNEVGHWAASGNVSAGGNHTCSIFNGQLACWGNNANGQLGIGTNTPEATPLVLQQFQDELTTSVSAGTNHTCAIKFGHLYCWGNNANGQLGIGTTGGSVNSPQRVAGASGQAFHGKRVTEVSAGTNNTCAVADGRLYCWGNNSHGKLGINNTTQHNTPQLVNGNGDLVASAAVTAISTGTDHTCAIANADAFCWGWNDRGRTGIGLDSGDRLTPARLTGGTAGTPRGPNNMLPSVSAIAAGNNHSCGIFNGMVSCWGAKDNGQLGLATETWTETGTPYKAACNYILWPLNPNNCDGRESCGFLCYVGYKWITPSTTYTNELRDKNIPHKIQGAAGGYYATQVSTGDNHTCALIHGDNSAANGNIYCWGSAANGRLGNGVSTGSSNVPLRITGGHTVDTTAPTTPHNLQRRVATSISTGPSSSCAIANGAVLCWGTGTNGKLGNSDNVDKLVPTITSNIRALSPYARGIVF